MSNLGSKWREKWAKPERDAWQRLHPVWKQEKKTLLPEVSQQLSRALNNCVVYTRLFSAKKNLFMRRSQPGTVIYFKFEVLFIINFTQVNLARWCRQISPCAFLWSWIEQIYLSFWNSKEKSGPIVSLRMGSFISCWPLW